MKLDQMMIKMGKWLGHDKATSGSTDLPEPMQQRVSSAFFVERMKKGRK
jgi:hypothetical protein